MILVTGAAGKTGLAVLHALKQLGATTRAFVKDDEQIMPVRQAGAAEVVVGDLLDADVWRLATTAVSHIYHLGPNMHPKEVRMGQLMVAAARASNCQVVYHSVIHPQVWKMPHHWSKLKVENFLFNSGLSFTVLRPTAYMQNLLPYLPTMQNDGILPVPYPADTRLSLVDLHDVATVAAKILTEPGHTYATYELVGTEPMSQTAVADTFSEILRRPVEVRPISLASWQKQAEARSTSKEKVDASVRMFAYYAENGMAGNPQVLRFLLGREPNSLADFINRVV